MSDSVQVSPAYGLHSYQRQVVSELLGYLAPKEQQVVAQDRRAVAHLPTGAGKTRIASHVACNLLNRRDDNALLVWLASSEELCEQAAEELARAWSYLGNREVAIHRFWGNSTLDLQRLNEGFLVAGLAKLLAAGDRSTGLLVDLSRRSAGVIFDEAHQAIAQTYEFVTEQLLTHRPPLLGLTATPGRMEKFGDAGVQLAEMFNFNKVTIDPQGHPDPISYLISNDYLAEPKFIPISFESDITVTEPLGFDDYSRQDLDVIGQNQARNDVIVQTTLTAIERNRRILIFCPSVESVHACTAVVNAHGVRAEAITATTPTSERQMTISEFKSDGKDQIALFNYGVLTAGFDAPRTRCVIIARPTTSLVLYSQMVGRAMRGTRSGGNKRCEVYTVADTNLPGFGSVTEAFNNWEELWQSN